MTLHTIQTNLSEFDLMMIRAGGRTETEFDTMAKTGFGLNASSDICAFLADSLYRIVILLEAGAHRAARASHQRLAAETTT